MAGQLVRPISEMGGRRQEQGRIRFGVKTAKAMKVIDTFRFTSPDREAIEQIAELYGGKCEAWSDPKANPQNQWEVITESKTIRVFLPPNGLTCWYEKWGGKGRERQCDGVTVELNSSGPDGYVDAPCVCDQQQRMECKPYTRLQVLLPEIKMGGVWRLETKSWNAAEEMPAMEAMAQQLQAYGVIEAVLSLSERSDLDRSGRRRHYTVPRIEFAQSAVALLGGAASVGALTAGQEAGEVGPGRPALPAAPTETAVEVQASTEPQAEWYEMGSESRYPITQRDAEVIIVDDIAKTAADLADHDVIDAEIVEEPFTTAHEDKQAAKPKGRVTKVAGPKVEAEPKPEPAPASATLSDRAKKMAGVAEGRLSPQHKKLHAMVGELMKQERPDMEYMTADAFRHAAVRTLTGHRTESTSDLSTEELSQLIDVLQDVLDGVRSVEVRKDPKGDWVQMKKLAQP